MLQYKFARSTQALPPVASCLKEVGDCTCAADDPVASVFRDDDADEAPDVGSSPAIAAMAKNNRGVLLGNRGQHEDALAGFHQAATLMPDDPVYQWNTGVALLHLGDFDTALDAFYQADSHEGQSVAELMRGIRALCDGDSYKAREAFEFAEMHDASNIVARLAFRVLLSGTSDGIETSLAA